MPKASSRTSWKGAISFGLVHIPVELRNATAETRQAFKWIDPSNNSAVGNRQINKTTGEAISSSDIVKGMELDDGRFVTLTREEIREALPKATQSIDIEAFVDEGSIPVTYFNKPYHVAPLGKGQKAYELLRATLERTHKVGLALVVISTKQHLCALMPMDQGLVLVLLRWAEEVRTMEGLTLPDKDIKVSPKELQMAEQLVADLTSDWEPDLFHDEFKEQVAALVEQKARAGKAIALRGTDEEESAAQTADVLDLSELLKRSLAKKPHAPAKAAANEGNVTPLRAAAARKSAPAKAVAKTNPKTLPKTAARKR